MKGKPYTTGDKIRLLREHVSMISVRIKVTHA